MNDQSKIIITTLFGLLPYGRFTANSSASCFCLLHLSSKLRRPSLCLWCRSAVAYVYITTQKTFPHERTTSFLEKMLNIHVSTIIAVLCYFVYEFQQLSARSFSFPCPFLIAVYAAVYVVHGYIEVSRVARGLLINWSTPKLSINRWQQWVRESWRFTVILYRSFSIGLADRFSFIILRLFYAVFVVSLSPFRPMFVGYTFVMQLTHILSTRVFPSVFLCLIYKWSVRSSGVVG